MESTVRRPAVAGRFYPGDPSVLLADVRSYLSPTEKTISAIGCVVPHAGYIYSGHVAGAVFARLNIPQRCIVLCPNHTGMGQPLALMSDGAWETPLGKVAVDSSLAGALKHRYSLLTEDADAHRAEHAVEVELPFLQAKSPNFTFVPIALGIGKFDVLESLGQAIGDVVKDEPEPVLIIASSDMNNYENDKITRVKDHKAIEKILALDARGLFDVVMNEDISMCGFGPTVAMLTAAKRVGATAAELIKYATSGDISGDREMVVGYAGIVVR
jgi:AmmeMemoRadiSam system protein B